MAMALAIAALPARKERLGRARKTGQEGGAESGVAEEELRGAKHFALRSAAHGAGEEDGKGEGGGVSDGPRCRPEPVERTHHGLGHIARHLLCQVRVQEEVPDDVQGVHLRAQEHATIPNLSTCSRLDLCSCCSCSRLDRRMVGGSGKSAARNSRRRRRL